MWDKIKLYVYFIGLSLLTGGLAAFLTRDNMNIYSYVTAPPLSPPMWLFPVVWTVLYVLMGVGSATVYRKNGRISGVFLLQLAMNFLWSIIFFNLKMYLFSSVWLVGLIVLIWEMIKEFKKIDKWAGVIQIPYIIWCVFALYLNVGIWWLNK